VRDTAEIQELEAEVALEQQEYGEVERKEAELLDNIPPQGFSAFPTDLKYRSEKETLGASMHIDKEMLAGLKSQPE
jgi:hypothetical protein